MMINTSFGNTLGLALLAVTALAADDQAGLKVKDAPQTEPEAQHNYAAIITVTLVLSFWLIVLVGCIIKHCILKEKPLLNDPDMDLEVPNPRARKIISPVQVSLRKSIRKSLNWVSSNNSSVNWSPRVSDKVILSPEIEAKDTRSSSIFNSPSGVAKKPHPAGASLSEMWVDSSREVLPMATKV